MGRPGPGGRSFQLRKLDCVHRQLSLLRTRPVRGSPIDGRWSSKAEPAACEGCGCSLTPSPSPVPGWRRVAWQDGSSALPINVSRYQSMSRQFNCWGSGFGDGSGRHAESRGSHPAARNMTARSLFHVKHPSKPSCGGSHRALPSLRLLLSVRGERARKKATFADAVNRIERSRAGRSDIT